jgi:branched-chain amino acid transport system substrate-binding protein
MPRVALNRRFQGATVFGFALLLVSAASAQGTWTCDCGKHPPGPPPDRIVAPYAGEPDDLRPFAKFTEPYDVNYIHPNIYSGAGRDIPDPTDLSEVRIGFIGPIDKQADQVFGLRMLHGAQLAVDEANAQGGYGGKPFRLMLHDDYNNWQFGAEYGAERPTASAIWGSASDEAVKMIYDEKDWAIFGSVSSETTHILLRVALRAEIPIVNSASTDPTIPETYIPWYFTNIQDDRVQDYTLARHIFTDLGLKRVALLRVNNRYGRFGVIKFRDAARRLSHPVVIEQKFLPGDTDFRRALHIIQDSHADAIVLWADETPAAQILQQMHELGMRQKVFGSYRTLGDHLLAEAGPAAEGFEAVFPYDPTRTDPRWVDFNRRFEARFDEKPEQFAALAYDAMNALLQSICKAGLNRARIHDALAQIDEYDGVTGHMIFDPNSKNVSPMYLGTVHDGRITYQPATMDAPPRSDPNRALQPTVPGGPMNESATKPPIPYARVGEEGVDYAGPHRADPEPGPVRIVIFGPQAGQVAETTAVRAALAQAGNHWLLTAINSDQNWGGASTELVHALMDERPLAVVSLDRNAAHLAEQLALKAFVPVVALSNDTALTATNVPWIFRLPPEAGPAQAIRLLAAAAETSGNNPERLRSVLASGATLAGMRFLPTGEPVDQASPVSVRP